MDDTGKKSGRTKLPSSHEKWLEKLAPTPGQTPIGVETYVGLLRQSPSDPDTYELFQTLDVSSSLQIRKEDVIHLEELASDKSPFGTLGGSKLYVRLGAKITSVLTSKSTFAAGSSAPDDFDLDIRLGTRRPMASPAADNTIPDTGCGPKCDKIPPYTDPDVKGCQLLTAACHKTVNTCQTNCGTCWTCQTCQTCGVTCQTCLTQCATCHTCFTHCGGAICDLQTHLATVCNPNGCVIKG